MDQFADATEIEVAFQIPDPANASATRLLTQRVTRGMTGVVISLRRPDAGQGRGSQVLCIIDSWEGDAPSTRVVTRPWP